MSVRSRLDETEVGRFLAAHRGWQSERGELRRTYDFKSFKESLRFVNEVAEMAERESHHPDIGLNYRRVTIALLTYDKDGVTSRDTEMAVKIDELKATLDSGKG
jgi:4a-hydroxytetrahydrobiopterin dehydratase